MLERHIICLFAALLLLSASAYATGSKTIYIDIVGEGRFEVIYHRAKSNATGAVIAGLIGAGIQSGIEASMDQEKTNRLRPLISKETWKSQFLDTLNDKLESAGFEAVWVEDTGQKDSGIVLKIYPNSYGFKMVDTSTHLVSAFIDFKASFSGGSSEEWDKEAFYLTSRNQHSYDRLLGEDSPVNPDLSSVLEKAARRLANKIIYSLKE